MKINENNKSAAERIIKRLSASIPDYKGFVTSIHTHMRSLYDADTSAKDICDRIKELGGSGICCTQIRTGMRALRSFTPCRKG